MVYPRMSEVVDQKRKKKERTEALEVAEEEQGLDYPACLLMDLVTNQCHQRPERRESLKFVSAFEEEEQEINEVLVPLDVRCWVE